MVHAKVLVSVVMLGWVLTSCKKIADGPSADRTVSPVVAATPVEADTLEPVTDFEDDELSLTTAACKESSNIGSITFSPSAELFITDPAVIEDKRTAAGGKWSFSYAMREVLELPSPGDKPDLLSREDGLVKAFIARLSEKQTVNTFPSDVRADTAANVKGEWKTTKGSDGKNYLTFDKAPFKLMAIVNRLDIVKKDRRSETAGEGRFIFHFVGPQTLNVIMEYDLAIGKASPEGLTLANWTKKWHSLKNFLVDTDAAKKGVQPDMKFPTTLKFKNQAAYLTQLQGITDRFANRKAQVNKAGGTQASISQIRSNELTFEWEMREMKRTYDDKKKAEFTAATVKNNPAHAFDNGQGGFKAWIATNVTCSDPKDRNTCRYNTANGLLPNAIGDKPLITGHDIVTNQWFPDSKDVKQRFVALNTCGGCHQGETGTSFTHVNPFTGPSAFVISEIKKPRKLNYQNLICLSATSKSSLSVTDQTDDDDAARLDFVYRVH